MANEFKKQKKELAEGRLNIRNARQFIRIITFRGISKESIVRQLPFIFFLTLLAIMYIANSYYAEKTIREIDMTNTELKELRSEYISVKSDLVFISRQSEIAKAVETMGIKESIVPPQKIVIKK